ncbi:uncharacterized protein LOC125238240 [Leguminivora glycinivorella]|uniref:uncharacterized protein LOC125238240 n=1 Tax=Leguminivora glycinivorella TaxID=1035111 RepID=UPI00200E0671|nr:uncharacterized protein LOC125238240 [Leguminivora glycinivorella]
MKFFLALLSLAVVAYSSPVPKDESVLKSVVGSFVNCMNSDVNLCIKEHALRATERLGTVRKLNIFEGLTILNSNPKEARSLEPLSTEPQIRNKEVTERLWEKANDLLQNSELEINFGGDDGEARSLDSAEEGRGKKKDMKKKIKMLMPLVLLLKAKLAALAVLFLGVIAISIWKLAVIAKIAFIAKIIAIIKALLAKKHEEHGGWAAPVHDDHGHGHGGWESQGWGRSGKIEGADMAYAGYKQQ